ncbi:topoisomerase I binding, arginine/serine-rich a isoform 2-T2 [Pholidichthys leucotaenia]
MSAIKIALRQSQKGKTSDALSAEVSPDSKCPICLDIFNNISYLDRCLHKFCFRCIHEWSKNKAECPLCKQGFTSIYHSIKSEHDFKKYDLPPVDNGSFGYFEGVRFRYRTTLTGVHRQMRGRTAPPPDNGVMFEAPATPVRHDRYLQRMLTSLADRRRAASEGRAVSNVREEQMINFRRELYQHGVRVRNVRDGGRSRNTSADFYRRNPACLHRLVPWLKRELTVLYGAHGSLVNIVQHIIMSRITRYDMEDGAIHEELRPFLQGRTEHFLHEFISFARSPFNMELYDQHAVYDCPAPSSNEDSSSNSSVIAISEDEENFVELDHPGNSTSALSQSVWDDETPGPSYSTTTEQGTADRHSVLESDSDSSVEEEMGASQQQSSPRDQEHLTQGDYNNEDCPSSDSDDCIIVGFVKPTAERTPELVQLSSDSSDSEDNKEVPPQSQHIRFSSVSPAASHTTEASGTGPLENEEPDHQSNLELKQLNSSSASHRHKESSKSDRNHADQIEKRKRSRERRGSKDRHHKRKKSKRREHRHSSRSPVSSHRHHSYSSSRDYPRNGQHHRRRDSNYTSQSNSIYPQERCDSWLHYTQRQSDFCSQSRSRSRESQKWHGRHSRLRSSSGSCSPSAKRKSHHEKPSGKRKYKTRHLEEPSKNVLSNVYEDRESAVSVKHKKKSKEKRHKKSKEKSKISRSHSVELVNEGKAHERSRHHKKKKKHKKSRRHKSNERSKRHSPTVITINSDSDNFANDDITKASNTDKENPVSNPSNELLDPSPVDSL